MVYDLEALRREYQQGQRYKFLFFWGHQPQADGSIGAGCLSQWWPCHFEAEGVGYTCAEQYMMAQKAVLFGDEEVLREIMNAGHPKQFKALGRKISGFKQDIWDNSCRDIVTAGNVAKFSQNSELGDYLINTKERVLVEASPYDKIWGIGMGKDNPKCENPSLWNGTNYLGFCLMEARDILRGERGVD